MIEPDILNAVIGTTKDGKQVQVMDIVVAFGDVLDTNGWWDKIPDGTGLSELDIKSILDSAEVIRSEWNKLVGLEPN